MADDLNVLHRALGTLEGRIIAMERGHIEAEARHATENTALRAEQAAMNDKLDKILAKLNQGIGGYRAGVVFVGLIGSLGAGAWTLWEKLAK